MERLKEILTQHPFFEGLEPKYFDEMSGHARFVDFQEGQFVIREGGEANQFYIIVRGKVAIEIGAQARGLLIQTIGEGDVLGWSWLVPPHRWRFDVRALVPTHAIAVDGEYLRNKCEKDHELGYELSKRLANIFVQRFRATQLQLLDLYGVRHP